jgi:hypothetical protein
MIDLGTKQNYMGSIPATKGSLDVSMLQDDEKDLDSVPELLKDHGVAKQSCRMSRPPKHRPESTYFPGTLSAQYAKLPGLSLGSIEWLGSLAFLEA